MPSTPLLRRAARTEWRVLAALLVAAALALGAWGGLGRADSTLYDAFLDTWHRPVPEDIVIVAIDEASIAKLGRWPWSRAVHARFFERLAAARPRAVGLDLILTEPEPAADPVLAAAIARVPTVLPVFPEQERASGIAVPMERVPVAPLAAAAAALGHIRTNVDDDGVARGAFLRMITGAANGTTSSRDHFALAVLTLGNPDWARRPLPGLASEAPVAAGRVRGDHLVRYPLAGGEGRVTRVSYVDVLEGRSGADALGGRYVLVGATAAGLGDAYPTPISGRSSLTPGIEMHANLLDALLRGRTIREAPGWASALFNALPIIVLLPLFLRLSPRRSLAATTSCFFALPVAAALLLRAGWWFAPAAGMLVVASAYPLWSWRRLEATVRFLGDEFRRLAEEPQVMPTAAGAPGGGDLVEARMLAVADAADRLRHLRRFVSDTLEGLPEAALVTQDDGRVLIANRAAAALFGETGSEALRGRAMTDLLGHLRGRHMEEAAPDWSALTALATPGPDGAAPEPLEFSAPGDRSLLARCARLNAGDGHAAGWIVAFADITPLREAERAREEVLAFLSHDMRSPQSSILALLELHELDPDDNPKEEVFKRIDHYARRTLSLSEQFLQLARAESKAHEPTVEDLGALAEEAVDDVWTAAEQKSIKVAMQWDGEPVPVAADKPLLLRAITNLLTNAVKYSPENTTVTVTVAAREVAGQMRHVCEVADQGYGISAEDQARLFERYRRFSAPGQPKAQGAGLGMAFVKTVVEKHGGHIAVASTLGKGSTFTLVLPPVEGDPDA